jgi:acyl-CoA synthetase (NDP forming)/RimJ/RimL family protein N-acetyltransferase
MSGEAETVAYPTRWEADVVLTDGGTVHVRPVRGGDEPAIQDFHARQSKESIYFRYFSPMPKLSQRELSRLTAIDYVTRMAFVTELGDQIVGMASYDVFRESNEAEVAFIVDDAHQGRGLATVLLEYLIVAARENGLERLTAQVLPTNRRMLSVFHQVGFEVTSSFEDGVVEVHLGLEATARSAELIEEREQRAEARSIQRLLFPTSVAVIGAGREREGIGHEVFRNLISRRFDGPVFPVNPQGGHVGSVRSYPSVLEVPDDIDLAIVTVPAAKVLDVVDECAAKRVHGLLIVSAGFDGLTSDGRPTEQAIIDRALQSGMRVIGPESLGLVNTAPTARMHATFTTVTVESGRVGFLTQSGTLGIAALEHAARRGIGISTFVDIGSRVDVSGNDLLQFWSQDDRTAVVLMYLESFGNPRKFTRIARKMSRHKPIVAVKSGRSLPPDREDPSGGLAAVWPTDATVDALLAQSGVIRVDTPPELFDVARVLVDQPVPAGRRVQIISNARGATLLSVDACLRSGLELASEPVVLSWEAGPDDYARAVRSALEDDDVHALLVIYAPPIQERRAHVARAIAAATSAGAAKPILATFLGSEVGVPLPTGDIRIPLFEFPGEAAKVLGLIAGYGEWLRQREGEAPSLDDLDVDAVRALVGRVLDERPKGRWMPRTEAADVLAAAGLPVAPHRLVRSAGEAVSAAAEIGFPVVLKAAGVERYHRGEAGGVALDLHDGPAVQAAFDRMNAALGDAMSVAVVQHMVGTGADILVGAHQHPSYGGVVSLGLGGVMAAANTDLPTRILPLTDADAQRLLAASPVAPLLGAEAADGTALRACEDFLLRLSSLLDEVPEIADLLLNPLIVTSQGAWVVDVWMRIAPYRWNHRPAVRRLT